MIELPGIGSLVLDAMFEGRWREAGAIAKEDASVTVDPAPRDLLVVVWEMYDRHDEPRQQPNVVCEVCGEEVEQVYDGVDEDYVLRAHGGLEECEGSGQRFRDSQLVRRRIYRPVPIGHALAPLSWPYRETGIGLEDMSRCRVGGTVPTIEASSVSVFDGVPVLPRASGLRFTVERRGVPRSFQVYNAKYKKLFSGIIGCQRTVVPGEIASLYIDARRDAHEQD